MPENMTATPAPEVLPEVLTEEKKNPTIIKQHLVRKLVRLHGKRISQEVLDQMEDALKRRLTAACGIHNGGKKTIDIAIAGQANLV